MKAGIALPTADLFIHLVFQGFGGLKGRHLAGGDFDFFAGRGVDAALGGAVFRFKGTESDDLQLVPVRHQFLDVGDKRIEKLVVGHFFEE